MFRLIDKRLRNCARLVIVIKPSVRYTRGRLATVTLISCVVSCVRAVRCLFPPQLESLRLYLASLWSPELQRYPPGPERVGVSTHECILILFTQSARLGRYR